MKNINYIKLNVLLEPKKKTFKNQYADKKKRDNILTHKIIITRDPRPLIIPHKLTNRITGQTDHYPSVCYLKWKSISSKQLN